MDFFEQQDHARRQSKTLVLLFMLAVVAIVLAVNFVMALLWIWSHGGQFAGPHAYPAGFFATNTGVALGLIGGGTLIEMFNLRAGGEAVAQMAGGRQVMPSSYDWQERRLLNVVEEMALASGISCPKVYVLDREEAINAFAAGYQPNEAVLAVTRGALDRLTREELQGVVAHEFSHILNGDIGLNLRLIGVLFGIQMIAGFGQHLMRHGARNWSGKALDSSRGPGHAVLYAVGLALFVVGYLGILCSRLIKSALSRQREFLADASAIQFTRSRDGIGGALRKIGGLSQAIGLGSAIRHPNAEQLSHLFLGAVRQNLLAGLFASHPPLAERLRRIYGRNVALLDAPELPPDLAATARLPDLPFDAPAPALAPAAAAPGVAALPVAAVSLNTAAPAVAAPAVAAPAVAATPAVFPSQLDWALRDLHAAPALVYALLLGQGADRELQLRLLKTEAPVQAQWTAALATAITALPPAARLPLLDRAMPTLKLLPQAGRDALLATVAKLIAADQKVTLAEFVLQTILSRRLALDAGRAVPVRFGQPAALAAEVALLFSLLAHSIAAAGSEDAASVFLRAAEALGQLRLTAAQLLPVAAIGWREVSQALDRLNQLAPLAKPLVIKALLVAAMREEQILLPAADLLRAICAALDAPVPPAISASYAALQAPDLHF
jgi:Zn-dependent protease with chaperone function